MGRNGERDVGEYEAEVVLDELYALPPSDFVPRREELAAVARTTERPGATRRFHAAHRATLAAGAASLLLRSRPEEAQRFLEPGRALREASATPDPSGLTELSAQRRRIVPELSRHAAALARDTGYPLSDAVQRDLETTLRAVLADPDAAGRWAAGRLESALSPPSGFPSDTATADHPASRSPRTPRTPDRAPSTTPSVRARKTDELAERRGERQERLAQARAAGEAAAEQELRDAREGWERAEQEQRAAEGRHRTAGNALSRPNVRRGGATREAERLGSRVRGSPDGGTRSD
ncbi:hypothetical protein WJ438_38650 [Streptomyces sp. GD-15H]|uniref:hypothetical protein n=1 Tax=Streptomyces sp. GD-15H TaxID=3129112 RepID=UPI0032562E89